MGFAHVIDVHADRPTAIELDAKNPGGRLDLKVPALPKAAQIGLGGVPADAVMDIALGDMNALLAKGVVIVDERQAVLLAGRKKRLIQRVLGRAALDPHRTLAAAIWIGARREGLGLLEVGQAVGIGPAREAGRRPVVVIQRVAAHPVQPVDRGGAAQHAPARLIDLPPAQMRLRVRMIEPVEAIIAEGKSQGRGHLDRVVPVAGPGLEQEHGVSAFGQARGDDCPGRSGSDDQVVVGGPKNPHASLLPSVAPSLSGMAKARMETITS